MNKLLVIKFDYLFVGFTSIIINPKTKNTIPAYRFKKDDSSALAKNPINNIIATIVKNTPMMKLSCEKRLSIK